MGSEMCIRDRLGAVFINYAKSLVSEALPASWMFIQGGLFILVVTALPEGVLGWIQGDGPRNLLQRFGLKRKIETYPSLEVNNKEGNSLFPSLLLTSKLG